MTTDQSTPASEPKIPHFGTRLQSAREALGLERKEAAAQLRLNEKVILMMEKDSYPPDLPVTFIRGYMRAYGKFLQIPEAEIKTALENVKPKPQAAPVFLTPMVLDETVSSSHYFMQIFTYLIIATLVALVGMWWWNHSSTSSEKLTSLEPQNQSVTEAIATPPLLAAPAVIVPQEDKKKPTTVAVAKRKKVVVKAIIPDEDSEDEEHGARHYETNSDQAD